MRILSAVMAALLATSSTVFAESSYQTEEFSDPDSPIPTLFTCMYAGHVTQLEPASIDIGLAIAIDETGASDELLDLWTADVVTFITNNLADTDWNSYWTAECLKIFAQAKEYYGY